MLKNILSNNLNKKILIMPVGLSGSGKTTLYKEISGDFDIEYISFDSIRIEMFEKKTGKKVKNKEDYREAFRFVSENKIKLLPVAKEKLLKTDKKIVYIDNTNLKRKSRNKFLCVADDFLKIAIFFEPDLKKCINRQFTQNRDKTVPVSVLLEQYRMIEPPELGEFDIIIRKRLKDGENCCNNWSFKRSR
ncbi:uridine kinase [Persephonella hydrogeniphila]|uniref:Uridine kinase n=2 Tax=Persephonella hydrogeniphila TaxID=198703 RepID=A0A285N002_9AQUI|nr:uridine kinase [Persephonella hydrogeniphila]